MNVEGRNKNSTSVVLKIMPAIDKNPIVFFFIEIDENCFCTLNLKYQLAPTYANGSLIKTEC